MPQVVDAAAAAASASLCWPPLGAFAQASSDAPPDWWQQGHARGAIPERQSNRQSPQISGSPHTTPTSPMNQSREMSQLSMFRLGSETEVERGSSCEGDMGPCTSDGMPASAPSSMFFNTGPSGQQDAPSAPTLPPRDTNSPPPLPPQLRAAEGGIVGLSTVGLDGDSGEQKASLDSSSMWSPMLTTGMAALQTTMGAGSSVQGDAPAGRLPAAPSLQSWAGSLEVPGCPAGRSSTLSSPAAAATPLESPPPSPMQEALGVGRDADPSLQGGSVTLSMLAQVTPFYVHLLSGNFNTYICMDIVL